MSFRTAILLLCLAVVSSQAWARVPSQTVFDQAPWRHNPLTSKLATEEDRTWYSAKRNDMRFQGLIQMMPNEFQLVSSRQEPEIQTWMDSAVLRLFNSPTGSLICQVITNGEKQRIQNIFGVS